MHFNVVKLLLCRLGSKVGVGTINVIPLLDLLSTNDCIIRFCAVGGKHVQVLIR